MKGLKQNDSVEAFLYYDLNNVLRATRGLAYKIDHIYSLKAVEIDKKGVYFEIKGGHIFLPFEERTYKIIKDMTYPVAFKEKRWLCFSDKQNKRLIINRPQF